MRYLLTSLVCLISCTVISQENRADTLIHLKNYSVLYSQKYLQPLKVDYVVICPNDSKTVKNCPENNFTDQLSKNIKTSRLEHYKEFDINSIWEKGHMAPRQSLACSCESVKETFTFLNCAIQHKNLNKNSAWRELEENEMIAAKLNSVSVSIKLEFNDTTNLLGDAPFFKALIPSGFYKTLIVNGDSTNYYFPNTFPESKNLEHYIIKKKCRIRINLFKKTYGKK